MILVDTSAWIEFLRDTGSPAHLRLIEAVRRDEAATTDVVMTELLAGARAGYVAATQRLLDSVHYAAVSPRDDAVRAAELYRHCRSKGVTIGSLNDCVIAAVALRNDLPVLHADADFTHLAELTDLRVVTS